jgi:hypothetical protein
MAEYPEVTSAITAILNRVESNQLYPTEALTAIVVVGGLAEVPEFSDKGLNTKLYRMFLDRLAQIGDPRLSDFLNRFFYDFMKALTSPALAQGGPEVPFAGGPEPYANMVAGFTTTIDVLVRGTLRIIRAPAASQVSNTLAPTAFPSSSASFVHLVAVGSITWSDGAARNVTVFVHSEALLVKAETAQIADDIVRLINDLAKFRPGITGEAADATRIIAVVAYNTEEGAVDQLQRELALRGVSWPVIVISKGPNGNTVATCAACIGIDDPNTPEDEAQLLANAIATAMGYPPGQPFPGEPPSDGSLFGGLTQKDINRIARECYWWYADPADPSSVWRCICQRLSAKWRITPP